MALKDIKFGASTWLWASPFNTQTIEELFPKISKLGFDVVEIAVEDPSLIDVKKVKEGLDRYGLEVTICGAFGSSKKWPQLYRILSRYLCRIRGFLFCRPNVFGSW